MSYNPEIYGTFLEGFVISAIPQPKDITPTFATVGISKTFYVSGKSFFRINAVYLSGAPYHSASTLCNPFSAIYNLSANNPEFFAYRLPASATNIESDKMLSITIPEPSSTGRFDIIIENPAGYGRFNTFSRKFGSYQPDYAEGIIVYLDNSI